MQMLGSTNTSYTLQLTSAQRNKLYSLCANSKTLTIRESVHSMSGDNELNQSYKDYIMTVVNSNPTMR